MSRIECKQKEIQGKKSIACTLTLYKEQHGGSSSRWGRKKSPAVDGGQRNWHGEDRQKLQKTQKQTENKEKAKVKQPIKTQLRRRWGIHVAG